MTRLWLLVVGLAVAAVPLAAARQDAPRFEVASVKKQAAEIPPTPPTGSAPAFSPTFRRVNSTLVTLIRFAYGVTNAEVIGGPEWVRKDLFEVHAKAATAASSEAMRPMVAALLAERFKLVLHREQRSTRGALLVMARDDGRVGPKLEKCTDPSAPPRAAGPVRILSPFILSGRCQPISSIAAWASAVMGVPVVDRTRLDGLWSYYVFYIRPERPRVARDAEQEALLPFDGALEVDLGLRLQESTGPFDVLVIDSVEQPTPN